MLPEYNLTSNTYKKHNPIEIWSVVPGQKYDFSASYLKRKSTFLRNDQLVPSDVN